VYLEDGSTPVNVYPTTGSRWTTATSLLISGLALDTVYYMVVAVRARSGLQLETVSTPALGFQTGRNGTWRTGTDVPVTVSPSKSDSWNSSKKWAAADGGVGQGYHTAKSLNWHGVIRYDTVDSQVAKAINLPTSVIAHAADNIAHHANISSAKVRIVDRSSVGAPAPWVHCYATKANYNSTAEPEPFNPKANVSTFLAPAPGKTKEHFTIMDRTEKDDDDTLTRWANHWLNGADAHNGILIFRDDGGGNDTTGHNGWATFTGVTATNRSWDLELLVSWHYQYPEDTDARML
jgi:hypothetical protein